MELKNDCQVDCIKEAFDKLYNSVMPFVDLTQFADVDTAFKELDKKVHSEIYILKKCLAERDRAFKALRKENIDLAKGVKDHSSKIESLEKENSELKTSNERLNAKYKSYWKALSETKADVTRYKMDNIRLREVIDGRDNEIHDLEKKIQDLEEENASLTEDVDALVAENTDLHTKLSSNEKSIENLKRSNSILRGDNETLWSKLEEADLDISKRPWHGDGNAMTDEQASYKSLVEAIEFQNKKIEELEAEKARLKETYDIHETTIKKENVDLSYGHEFEFGDEVFVPWSDGPYMYVKSGLMYNPRTERLVYVGKDQHLKWFGEKFSIV